MKIVIIGLGTIGKTILKTLAKERHTVTIIDENKEKIEELIEKYDVYGVVGNGACMDIQKEAAIQKAKGEAEAILEVQQAKAQGIKMIKEAGADDSVIKLRSLEAFEAAADGQATKIIIPSDIQNIAGLVTSVTEIAKSKK